MARYRAGERAPRASRKRLPNTGPCEECGSSTFHKTTCTRALAAQPLDKLLEQRARIDAELARRRAAAAAQVVKLDAALAEGNAA